MKQILQTQRKRKLANAYSKEQQKKCDKYTAAIKKTKNTISRD